MNVAQFLAALAGATVCGLLAQRFDLPGGLVLGAMVGAALVTLISGTTITMPRPVSQGAIIVIGASIGIQLTRQAIVQLGPVIVPAVLSAVLLIIAGLAVAYALRRWGIAPPGDVLATSPGGISVLIGVAVEQGRGAVEVALFHLVRIVLVILSLPLLVALLRDTG